MKYMEAVELLVEAAEETGRPYVIDDGATSWDGDALIDELNSIDDWEDDEKNEYGFSENASSGLAIAKYNSQGFLESIPIYRVRFTDEEE